MPRENENRIAFLFDTFHRNRRAPPSFNPTSARDTHVGFCDTSLAKTSLLVRHHKRLAIAYQCHQANRSLQKPERPEVPNRSSTFTAQFQFPVSNQNLILKRKTATTMRSWQPLDQRSDHSVRLSTDTNGEANPTLHREGGPRSASAVCVLRRAQKLTDHTSSETYDDTTRLSVIVLNDVLAIISLPVSGRLFSS